MTKYKAAQDDQLEWLLRVLGVKGWKYMDIPWEDYPSREELAVDITQVRGAGFSEAHATQIGQAIVDGMPQSPPVVEFDEEGNVKLVAGFHRMAGFLGVDPEGTVRSLVLPYGLDRNISISIAALTNTRHGRNISEKDLERLTLQAVKRGVPQSDVADAFQISRHKVNSWVQADAVTRAIRSRLQTPLTANQWKKLSPTHRVKLHQALHVPDDVWEDLVRFVASPPGNKKVSSDRAGELARILKGANTDDKRRKIIDSEVRQYQSGKTEPVTAHKLASDLVAGVNKLAGLFGQTDEAIAEARDWGKLDQILDSVSMVRDVVTALEKEDSKREEARERDPFS